MYDDVANSQANPYPGTLINHIGGDDVYKGVVKDYTGTAVTPETFTAVLTGDENAVRGLGSGKVLKSGPNDKVFVYFTDHGGVGLIAFPNSIMSSHSLNSALQKMHQQNMYKKLVFYLEACESGSMFEGILSKDINIYATTAANSQESSYACYYDQERETFLGDLYSVNWMEDSDRHFNLIAGGDSEQWSLYQQFQKVQKLTSQSHVMEFGDISMRTHPIEYYQTFEMEPRKIKSGAHSSKKSNMYVDSRQVNVFILKTRLENAQTLSEIEKIERELGTEIKRDHDAKMHMLRIVDSVNSENIDFVNLELMPLKLEHHNCMHEVVTAFDKYCQNMDEYHLRYTSILAKACQREGVNTKQLVNFIVNDCDIIN
jgi:legumain